MQIQMSKYEILNLRLYSYYSRIIKEIMPFCIVQYYQYFCRYENIPRQNGRQLTVLVPGSLGKSIAWVHW